MTDDEMLRQAIEASRRVTRRRFLRGTGAALGGLAVGPALLAACGDDDDDSGDSGDSGETSEATTSKGSGSADDNDLYHANWPGYLDDESPGLWEQQPVDALAQRPGVERVVHSGGA